MQKPSSDIYSNWNSRQPNEIEDDGLKLPFPLLALIFVLLMVLLVNAGFTPARPGRAASEAETPGAVLFSDDFSDPPGGWGIWSRDGSHVEYYAGGLRILVKEPQFDFWSVAGKQYADVQIEVDAVKLSGPDDNDLGIICRYQDKNNFYMLIISSDGYYGIAKMVAGSYSMIGSEQLQYSGEIAKGSVLNHLRADCVGSTLSLYANRQKLMEAQDSAFTAGDVGLLAGAYNVPGVDILFDNFIVKKP
jgi:hypothetical protein